MVAGWACAVVTDPKASPGRRAGWLHLIGGVRSEADSQACFGWMLLAHVSLAGALVWIYQRGMQARPWLGQGLRFGVAVALLTVVPTYLIYYAVQPMPGAMLAKQIVFDGALVLPLGLLVAFLSRTKA